MIGNQPIPFCDLTLFWENSVNSYDAGLLRHLEESWLVEGLDTKTSVVVNSEEQIEATAKGLYRILGMEGDFIPQSDTFFSDKAGYCASKAPNGLAQTTNQRFKPMVLNWSRLPNQPFKPLV